MSVQKQIGELDQQPKPANGAHAAATVKTFMPKRRRKSCWSNRMLEAPQPPPHSISNWIGKQGSPHRWLPRYPSGDRFLRCCRSAGPLPLLEGSGP
jgi:hypothetical protein